MEAGSWLVSDSDLNCTFGSDSGDSTQRMHNSYENLEPTRGQLHKAIQKGKHLEEMLANSCASLNDVENELERARLELMRSEERNQSLTTLLRSAMESEANHITNGQLEVSFSQPIHFADVPTRFPNIAVDERMKTLSTMLRSSQEIEALLLNECEVSKHSLHEKEMELQVRNLEKKEMVVALEKFQETTQSLILSLDRVSLETKAAKSRILELETLLEQSKCRSQEAEKLLKRFFRITLFFRPVQSKAVVHGCSKAHKIAAASINDCLLRCCWDSWLDHGLQRKQLAQSTWSIVTRIAYRIRRTVFIFWNIHSKFNLRCAAWIHNSRLKRERTRLSRFFFSWSIESAAFTPCRDSNGLLSVQNRHTRSPLFVAKTIIYLWNMKVLISNFSSLSLKSVRTNRIWPLQRFWISWFFLWCSTRKLDIQCEKQRDKITSKNIRLCFFKIFLYARRRRKELPYDVHSPLKKNEKVKMFKVMANIFFSRKEVCTSLFAALCKTIEETLLCVV